MIIKKTFICGILFVALFATSFFFFIPDSHAVRVSLKRIVFEGTKKTEIITIINNSAVEKTYRLGWRRYRMDEGKSIRAVAEGEDTTDILWADDMVRFAPRRVKVGPGQSQQIRLLFRRPKDLQEAEYRAHLWIVSEVAPQKFNSDSENNSKQAVRLSVQPAISLPIFVRNGNLNAEVSITNAKLTNTTDPVSLSFTLNRQGNRSVYGDFDFTCIEGGRNVVIGKIRGVSVYNEIKTRNLEFNLSLESLDIASCNRVRIEYRSDPDDVTFKGKTLATAEASL